MNLSIDNKLENESLESNSDEEFSDDFDDCNSTSDSDESSNNIEESTENQSLPEKKKRGRKRKPKDETIIVEKVQKKRGRKPKIKEVDTNDKVPKKRGRKPKEKIYSVKELPKTFFEENKNETFILHLPIKTTDKNNSNSPLPNINNDMGYSIYDEDMNNYNINNNNLLPTQLDLLEDNLDDNLLIKKDISSLVFDNDNEKLETYEKKDINITTVIKKEEENDDEIKTNRVIKKNLRNIMYEFINSNNERNWPESTNIYCWWCCHQFTGTPCAMPEYYKKDKFYVSGCFCSFNCAASYSFSKNDNNIWERYSLLNLMYKKLYHQKFTKINMAPPREVLKIFGGYMSIEEFRENSLKNEKTFTVIRPPLISVIPKIEENISTINKNLKNNIPIVNENILNKTQSNLKLKRNKPVTNPNNTLQSFMDLKII
jgi:hypothetical protein